MSKKDYSGTANNLINKFITPKLELTHESTPHLQEEAPIKPVTTRTKSQRINMAFTDTNMDYIRVMSKLSGQSMTDFVNALVAANLEKNGETYNKAKEFVNQL